MTAKNAHGTLLQIGDGGSPESFNTIPGCGDISGLGILTETKQTTTHDTTGRKEYTAVGLPDTNPLTVSIEWDPADNVHESIKTDAGNQTLRNFRVVVRNGESDQETYEFGAIITNLSESYPVEGTIMRDLELRPSGDVTES